MEIVDGLGSSRADERERARDRLDNMNRGEALKLLLSALGSGNWRIRKAAADALVSWNKPDEVADSLISFLGEVSDASRRNAAVEVLIKIGPAATRNLTPVLDTEDPHVRKLIVDILGAIADPESETLLIEKLHDEDDNVRMAAAEALGNFRNGRAQEALLQVIRGPDMPMRFYAMESLSRMEASIPIEDIAPLLDQRILRRAALAALGNCGENAAVDLLIEALMDNSKSNRQVSVRSLARLYEKHSFLRDRIARRMNAIKERDKILDTLIEIMDSANSQAQVGAIKLMSLLSAPHAAPHLVRAMRESSLQAEAVEALHKLANVHRDAVARAIPPKGDPLRELVQGVLSNPAPRQEKETTNNVAPRLQTLSMTGVEFRELRDHMHKSFGIFFNDDMKFILEKRLSRRLEALDISDFSSYLDLLRKGEEEGTGEIGEAINILTTNETYFFREKFQLDAFKGEILPNIRRDKVNSADRRLRIWSAGCSSGEEVYTIAILVGESGMFGEWDIEVLGSDISSRVLDKARKAVYSKNSFRETPQEYLDAYFRKQENGDYSVKKSVRELVRFSEINLVEKDEVISAGTFDVIFCRNVIIYFDLEIKRRVIDYLYRALEPGGYLLLGHSESLLNISNKFDLVHLKNDMVYRKPLIAEARGSSK